MVLEHRASALLCQKLRDLGEQQVFEMEGPSGRPESQKKRRRVAVEDSVARGERVAAAKALLAAALLDGGDVQLDTTRVTAVGEFVAGLSETKFNKPALPTRPCSRPLPPS